MIFTLKKFLAASALVGLLHLGTSTPFTIDFMWIDVFFLIVAYVLVLAAQAIYLGVKDKYEYQRDKAAAEAEILAKTDEEKIS